MPQFEERRLSLWQGTIAALAEIAGEGPPLVYLHGPWGLAPDRDFVARLSRFRRVYAPHHPGTAPGDPEAVHRLDDWLDLVVYHGELFDRLGLASAEVIGHSSGGMLAAELAAAMPERVKKLVLIDPVGLWRDDLPIRNWMILPEDRRPSVLFADPAGPAAERFFALPADAAVRAEAQASLIWAQAATGKFLWPIPDRGLKKRIHRIAAPTLILWGTADSIIPPAYAAEFAARIKGARTALLDGAGHLPHLDRPDEAVRHIAAFLG
jgi:pimeloyl-ACP methyl ester carboxylesterase